MMMMAKAKKWYFVVFLLALIFGTRLHYKKSFFLLLRKKGDCKRMIVAHSHTRRHAGENKEAPKSVRRIDRSPHLIYSSPFAARDWLESERKRRPLFRKPARAKRIRTFGRSSDKSPSKRGRACNCGPTTGSKNALICSSSVGRLLLPHRDCKRLNTWRPLQSLFSSHLVLSVKK